MDNEEGATEFHVVLYREEQGFDSVRTKKQASEVLYDLFVRGDAGAEVRVAEERRKIELVSTLRSLRENSGMTRTQLARKVGTTAAEIARLEDPDYENHSLEKLQRVVSAFGKQLELHIVEKAAPRSRFKPAGAA